MLFRCFFCFILFVQFNNCIGQNNKYNVLNDVICELLGEDYYYESYANYYRDTLNKSESYDDYLTNRKILNDSLKVIFLNNFFELPKGKTNNSFKKLENDSLFTNNIYYKKLLDDFIINCSKRERLEIRKIIGNCKYQFANFSDKRINNFRPSESASFFISKIVFSKDKKSACFYFAGGRGSYDDSFVVLNEKGENWIIVKKIPVSIY